jgi:nucleoside-diphosphate-sugar epimerase
MHIALTGASGFIGSVIARHLHEAGHTIAALVRPTSRRDHIEPYTHRFVVGDQADEDRWPDLLDGADCLVHNAVDWQAIRSGDTERHYQSNIVGALKLIEAAGDRQVIYMSSIAVHHDMRPRWEGLIDEDHPTRPSTLYGACKAAIEAHLWSAHFSRNVRMAAIRPCAVYGIDPSLDRSIGYPIIEQVRRGKAFKRPGGGKFVHVDDVAAVTCALVGNPKLNAGVFNLADCYARWADLALMACELLGVDVSVETSSPPQSKNRFTKDAVQALGVSMDRGHDGIREHLRALIEAMSES